MSLFNDNPQKTKINLTLVHEDLVTVTETTVRAPACNETVGEDTYTTPVFFDS